MVKHWTGPVNVTARILKINDEIDRAIDSMARPRLFVPMPINGVEVTGRQRPPWWQPFARRRWDRMVELARSIQAQAYQRMLDRYPNGIILRGEPPERA